MESKLGAALDRLIKTEFKLKALAGLLNNNTTQPCNDESDQRNGLSLLLEDLSTDVLEARKVLDDYMCNKK